MQLLVFSDAHGDRRGMRSVLERVHPDAVLFLGDGLADFEAVSEDLHCLTVSVRGNCDPMREDVPEERLFDYHGCRILMLHGHTRFVKHGTEALVAYAKEQGVDLVLYGHTHTPDDRYVSFEDGSKPLRLLNPGSVRGGAFGSPTFATVLLQQGQTLTNIAPVREAVSE